MTGAAKVFVIFWQLNETTKRTNVPFVLHLVNGLRMIASQRFNCQMMPKVQKDDQLIADVDAIIKQHGSCGNAAKRIGVDRGLLWRFQKSGCAIDRNRDKLRKAISSQQYETNESKSERIELPRDLRTIREICRSLIMMIDRYDTWSSGGQTKS